MRKIIVIVIILIILTGCKSKDASINFTEEHLNTVINELNDKIENLGQIVKANDNYIKELENQNSEMKKELNVVKNTYEKFNALDMSVNRLNRYVAKLPQYEKVLGYMTKYDEISNSLYLNQCEWIGVEDIKRISELDLDPDRDFPNNFYIYDIEDIEHKYNLTDKTEYYKLDSTSLSLEYTSQEEFIKSIEESNRLCSIILINGEVIDVSEVYTP